MELDRKVAVLSDDIAGLKNEMGRTRAMLGDLLDKLDDTAATSPPLAAAASFSENGNIATVPEGPRPVGGDGVGPIETGGGLLLSQEQLDTVLEQAGGPAGQLQTPRAPNATSPRLSLEGLPHAVKQASATGTSERPGASNSAGHMKMSLSELARMMKAAGRPGKPHARSSRPKAGGAPTGVRTRRRDNPKPCRATAGTLAGAGTVWPRGANAPTRATTATPSDALRADTKVVRKASRTSKLDVNLMSSLIRWVGSSQRTLGVRNMHAVLETYRLTGHLPPVVEKTVDQLCKLDLIPHNSASYETPPDDMIDAVQRLHGIVYGSGRAPVGPAVEQDRGVSPEASQTPSEKVVRLQTADTRPESSPFQDARASEPARPMEPLSKLPIEKQYEHVLSAFRARMDSGQTSGAMEKAKTVRWSRPLEMVATGAHVNGAVAGDSTSDPFPPWGTVRAHPELAEGMGAADRTLAVQEGPRTIEDHRSKANGVNGTIPGGRRRLPTDLTDAEWSRVESLVPAVKRGGRPSKYDRREILNGILYQSDSGVPWRRIPKDLPPWKLVHHYYRTWRDDGTWNPLGEALSGMRQGSPARSGGGAADPPYGVVGEREPALAGRGMTREGIPPN